MLEIVWFPLVKTYDRLYIFILVIVKTLEPDKFKPRQVILHALVRLLPVDVIGLKCKCVQRFQDTMKKFVNSMGEMEQRLEKLEVNVQNVQKKQESFHVNSEVNSRQRQEPVNHDAENEQEANTPDFVGCVCNCI